MAEEELEQFRRQWQEEVRTRDRIAASASRQTRHGRGGSGSDTRVNEAPKPTRRVFEQERAIDGAWNFDNLEENERSRQLGESGTGVHPEAQAAKEPATALEYYEKAVECETRGKLGDSVANYRKAFKLNERVDQQYRNKHFPPSSFAAKHKVLDAESGPSTKPHDAAAKSTATSELIASFVDDRIEPAPPLIEGTPPPKCPISKLPTEVLGEILYQCAMSDLASLAQLSSVCKRLAYLVAIDEAVWKQVCQHSRIGFNSMHHQFACTLRGKSLEPLQLPDLESLSLASEADPQAKHTPRTPLCPPLPLSSAYPSYKLMFQHRPRLRFSGVYISTVNYVRPGQAGPNQLTWNSPLHVVTYYRYLRFYRDGSCLSLLTTVDPPEVVPYFVRDHPQETPGVLASPGLAAVAKHTLRGRWRMSPLHPPEQPAGAPELEPEGHILVETAGPTPAYTYSMQLALRSSGSKGTRNTKLVWRGFWSYNKITDDWAEFGLRNDRAFVWSRVKSWSDE